MKKEDKWIIYNENGFGTIEAILITVVLITLVLIFKDYLIELMDTIMQEMTGKTRQVF